MCKSESVYHIFFATATTNRHLFAKIKIGDGFSIVKNRHLFKKSRLGDGLLWREYFCDCRAETTVSINICHHVQGERKFLHECASGCCVLDLRGKALAADLHDDEVVGSGRQCHRCDAECQKRASHFRFPIGVKKKTLIV